MEEQTDGWWPGALTADEITAIRSILAKTHELIPTPARWTRFAFARDSRGKEVSALGPNATRFCVSGAILAATHRLFVVRADEDTPVAGGVLAIESLTAKALAFVGLAMALISYDHQVTRFEPTRIGFLDPDNGDEDGFVYDDYWKVPATINDSAGVKHRHMLALLDQTRDFLDRIEKLMEARTREGKPVGKRVRTSLPGAPSSKPSPKRRGRASKPSGGEASDES